MKLTKVQVQCFRNILDSTEVKIQQDVTCLVGKNESGKTAFLEALRRLQPAQGNPGFVIGKHYPAWLEKRHRREGKDLEAVKAVTACFALEEADKEKLKSMLGEGVFNSDEITVSRTYKGECSYDPTADEGCAVSNLIHGCDLPKGIREKVESLKSFDDLLTKVEKLREDGDEQKKAAAETLNEKIGNYFGENENFWRLVSKEFSKLVPKFFYFAEYSKLPGIVKIRDLFGTDDEDLDDSERTAKSLLMQAGAENEYLLNSEYESRKRELENVANDITQDVLEYWTTNTNLRVMIDISKETVDTPNGQQAVLDDLRIRMWDNEHMLSLPFEARSSGFQWFFSFLSAFSEYERSDDPVVILLDEPGVGLHARAQADFLRFIDKRLAKRCQVIYTTHSPFMIQPDKLDRARIVEDRGRQEGVIVSSDILATDSDTLFPLQGALGYDLAQNLFIGPDNLVVEGVSDYIYLSVMSSYLSEKSREGLNQRWTVMPVGGADLVPTFVALLGGKKLDFTVLVDSRKEGHQKLQSLAKRGFLAKKRIVTIDQVLDRKLGDIEDIFTLEDYLKIYNPAFEKGLNPSELSGDDPIVRRIARAERTDRFDHGKPAGWLLRHRDEVLPSFSDKTSENFEKLFALINATLGR